MPASYGRATKAAFESPNLEDNYYRAQVADVADSTGKWDGVETPQYRVKFELLDEEDTKGEPVSLSGFIRIPDGLINDGMLNENSKLYQFLIALGYTDENLEVEPQDWQGQKLRIQVVNKKIETGERKGQVVPRVVGYSPLRQAKAADAASERRQPKAAKPSPAVDDDPNDF